VGDRPWLYGKAIVNGEPRFHSVSRLSGADPNEGGCLRKWHYEMVMGRKSPGTRASKRGDGLHDEIEKYLKTGDRSLSSLALSGLHMVPEPGPDLLVEHDLVLYPRDVHPHAGLDLSKPDQRRMAEARAAEFLARAPLRADGVPVLGRMDLIHGRGTNKGGVNIEETIDPPNTVEVLDWKSTGNPNYIKRAKDLPKLIQMAGYAEWVYRVEPQTDQVRLSHGYFVERGGPSRKVTLRVIRDDVARTWEHAEGVARSIRHAARETDPDLVDANTGACDNYGGCYHREVCRARMHSALASFVGASAADKLLGKQQETASMGLLDKMKAGQTGATAPAPAGGLAGMIGAPAAPQASAPSGPTPEQIAAEKARLDKEEAEQRALAQLRLEGDKLLPIYRKIEAYSTANPALGMPAWLGSAARALCVALKSADIVDRLDGSGQIAGAEIADVAGAEAILKQLEEVAAAGHIKAPSSPSPLAGLGTPSKPVEVTSPAPETKSEPSPEPPKPDPDPNHTRVGDGTNRTIAQFQADEAKKTEAKKTSTKPKKSDAITLVVDGFADLPGSSLESFHPIFDAFCAELATETNDLDLRAAGLRKGADGKLVFAKDDSPLTFSRADGALAAMIREREVPPGTYYFSTRGNRMAEVAAEAMRDKCRKSGGAFFWGTR
jgi:hypothetical protein